MSPVHGGPRLDLQSLLLVTSGNVAIRRPADNPLTVHWPETSPVQRTIPVQVESGLPSRRALASDTQELAFADPRAAIDRPACGIYNRFRQSCNGDNVPMPHLVLLTAARGAGKSTACQRFVELAQDAGMQIGGILAPPRHDDRGRKAGIDAVDVTSGERRHLAVVEPDIARQTVGRYRFHQEVMDWALECVMRALDAPIDVVIIDEIGPLELVQRGGFAPALEGLPSAKARGAVLVVRAELLANLREHVEGLEPEIVALSASNRDQMPCCLLKAVGLQRTKPVEDADEGKGALTSSS